MILILNIFKSFIFSIILPGLSQLYFGKKILSFIIIVLYLSIIELFIINNIFSVYEGLSLFYLIVFLFIFISFVISIIHSIKYKKITINRFRWYYFILIIVIVYFIIIISFYKLTDLRGYHPLSSSMEPTISTNDYFLVSTKYYSTNELSRNDIVIFNPPRGEVNKYYAKRCIALPGESFKISNNKVFINNKPLNEQYVIGHTSFENFPDHSNIEGIVPENCIIVLGDNREKSLDSRFFGYVPIV